MEWWTTQKDAKPNLMGSLPWSTCKAKLNELFTLHNQILEGWTMTRSQLLEGPKWEFQTKNNGKVRSQGTHLGS